MILEGLKKMTDGKLGKTTVDSDFLGPLVFAVRKHFQSSKPSFTASASTGHFIGLR